MRSAVAPSTPKILAVDHQQVGPLVGPEIDVVVVADELVDQLIALDLRIALVVDERLNLLGRRRQAGEVEIHAADEFVVVALVGGQRFRALELGGDELVDLVVGRRVFPVEAGAIAHYGERRGGVLAFVADQGGRFAAAERFEQAGAIGHRFDDVRVAAFDERFARDVALAAVGIGRDDANLLPSADRFNDRILRRHFDAGDARRREIELRAAGNPLRGAFRSTRCPA